MVGNRKSETISHSILKHLIASILERRGHIVFIEFHLSDGFPDSPIADVFDKTTGLVYEIQSRRQKKTEKEKCNRYLLHIGITDVIFVYVTDFTIQMQCNLLYKFLEAKI